MITPDQFGFMSKHSYLQQLLVFIDAIVNRHEQKSLMDVVYVDTRKPFDNVAHGELLNFCHKQKSLMDVVYVN